MKTEELPSEIEKIRDERSTNRALETHPVVWIENKLTGLKTDPNYPSRKFKEDNYRHGFNDAFHLGRQFERDELAKRAPEWETFGKQIIKEIDERLDCGYMPGMSTYLKIAYQQTSLFMQAKIAKLEAEIERLKHE